MTRRFLAIALAAGMLLAGSAGAASAEGLLIIANPSVGIASSLSLNQIAAIYLLRVTTWPDGTPIVPVNREAGSEIRTEFTSAVLRQDDASLATYWNQMHFMGKLPPLVQESEQAMLAFIRKVPGSIGYISATDRFPTGVEVLAHVP
jgi:ABC-type phosphate transport system substrate-binding protein